MMRGTIRTVVMATLTTIPNRRLELTGFIYRERSYKINQALRLVLLHVRIT